MADLTELDVETLDMLLQIYLDLVYLPECEDAYRRDQRAQTQQVLDAQAKLGPFDKALFDPDHPPELPALLNIDGQRKQFVDTYLKDDWIPILVPLFERAGLNWDAALAKEKGRLAAIRKPMYQWSKEEWGTLLPDPKSIDWDPDIIDEHPSGGFFIGPQSRYDAAVKSASVARAMKTLANIAGGMGGTMGYFAYGDVGSDVGAGAAGILPGGGRKGRANRRNSRRKSAGSRDTGSPATASRGTGSTGIDSPLFGPRRTKPSKPRTPPKQPAQPKQAPAAPPPQNKPERRTSEQRADARAASAQAVAAGKKFTPSVLAKFSKANIDMKDEATLEKVTEIFTVNRIDDALLQRARANNGELRAIFREGKSGGVKRVRFLRVIQGKGERTPDIEVTMKDGTKKFVEVRTVTGSLRDATVKDAKSVRAPISAQFIDSVKGKLHHGQISEKNPGKILFHAPFQDIDMTALEGWREMFGMIIREKGPMPKGLKRIEVTGVPSRDGKTKMLIFEEPKWRGVLVD